MYILVLLVIVYGVVLVSFDRFEHIGKKGESVLLIYFKCWVRITLVNVIILSMF
jgi:hypothetical protein